MRAGELEIESTWNRGELTLALRGELDLASAPTLQQYLHDAQASGAQRVAVDLHELEFMDGVGLRVLLEAHQRLLAQQRPGLFLRRARPNIQRFLALTSADSIFESESEPDQRRRAQGTRRRGR